MEKPKITNGPWFPVEYCGYIIVQDENNYGGLNVFDMDHFPLANNNAVAASATHELIDQYYFLIGFVTSAIDRYYPEDENAD